MGGPIWKQDVVRFLGRAAQAINSMRLDLEMEHGVDSPTRTNERLAMECALHNLEEDCRATRFEMTERMEGHSGLS